MNLVTGIKFTAIWYNRYRISLFTVKNFNYSSSLTFVKDYVDCSYSFIFQVQFLKAQVKNLTTLIEYNKDHNFLDLSL